MTRLNITSASTRLTLSLAPALRCDANMHDKGQAYAILSSLFPAQMMAPSAAKRVV